MNWVIGKKLYSDYDVQEKKHYRRNISRYCTIRVITIRKELEMVLDIFNH